uniref:Nucleotidyltransferase family protein n=1 Tax=Schlesneria paludicola TaxID=360056 RepID=A0A7C2JX89_9PLAN
MTPLSQLPLDLLDRMERAVEKVRERLTRAAAALDAVGVPYAVIGGNAVGAWVATEDESAVRNTQDVDLLLRAEDLDRAAEALSRAGFIRRHSAGIEMFLDGPHAKARDAVHVILAGQKVRDSDPVAAPDVEPWHQHRDFRLLPLRQLVQMKLTSFRLKDQVHLQDMVQVGLIDDTWPDQFPPPLSDRLRQIIENPEA